MRRLVLPLALLAVLGSGRALAGPAGLPLVVQVAKVVAVTPVRARAGGGLLVGRLATRTRWNGHPQQLLVLDTRRAHGVEWLRVRLPGRPNGSSGWIRRDDVVLRRVDVSIDVSLSQRLVRVYRGGKLVRSFRAVVGAGATPTPVGLFAVYELDHQADPYGFLGPWVVQLTAFSNVLESFGGGPGRVALHGRGGASLGDPLGSARSHGCVRVGNADISWLAHLAVPGTPVRIHA